MGAAAPAAITAGAGLIGGSQSNKAAQHSANQANAQAKTLTDAQMKLFNTLFSKAQQGEAALNPDTQIKQLASDRAIYDPIMQAGQAGADRTAGYMPTDSEAKQHQNTIAAINQQSFIQQANAIRRNAPSEILSLYSPLAGGSGLNPGIQNAQYNQGLAYSRMQNPGSFLQAAMQGFNPSNSGFNLTQNAVNQGRINPPSGNNPFYS